MPTSIKGLIPNPLILIEYLTCAVLGNQLPIITSVTYPNGNCCDETPIITSVTYPNGDCCED